MDNPTNNTTTQNQTKPYELNLSDAPGGDISFDELFPAEGTTQATTLGNPPSVAPQAPQPEAQPSAEEQFFLKTGNSVYKTEADAIKGVTEKDQLIENLRQQHIQATGLDPVSGRPVGAPRAPQGQQTPVSTTESNFAQDGAAYVRALTDAYQRQDWNAYGRTQQKFLYDSLAPIAPVFVNAAKQQAISAAESDIKDIRGFIGSEDYNKTLGSNEVLKQAIAAAESDMSYHQQLPGLYKLAYQANQSRTLPELLKAAQAATAQTAAPPRPTATSSTMAPPQPGTAPDIRTPEGRKAIIEQFEQQGLDKSHVF